MIYNDYYITIFIRLILGSLVNIASIIYIKITLKGTRVISKF